MDISYILTTTVGIVGSIVAAFGSIFIFFKYILVIQYRLRPSEIRNLHEWIHSSHGLKFTISEEIVMNKAVPSEYRALVKVKNHPFVLVNMAERLLTAGWQSKESVGHLYCLRWSRHHVLKLLQSLSTSDEIISSYILRPWSEDKIGSLANAVPPSPVVLDASLELIENEIRECLSGNINKTGILLHGPPGTGKTMLVKYLALKFGLAIKLPLFKPDYGNDDIMTMFAGINDVPSIILFEDFDSVFHGRQCLLGSMDSPAKFSFDSILNVLDGVHNTYRNTIFILTVNDLDKVDPAIRYRPSRIRFMREMKLPDRATRLQILKNQELTEWTDGCNLDIVFMVKSQHDTGISMDDIRAQLQERMDRKLILMTDRGPIF